MVRKVTVWVWFLNRLKYNRLQIFHRNLSKSSKVIEGNFKFIDTYILFPFFKTYMHQTQSLSLLQILKNTFRV